MSREEGFGKKDSRHSDYELQELPKNASSCPYCGQELAKLELFIGSDYSEGLVRKYNSYWKLMCLGCSRLFKQLDSIYIHDEDGLSGKGRLREE